MPWLAWQRRSLLAFRFSSLSCDADRAGAYEPNASPACGQEQHQAIHGHERAVRAMACKSFSFRWPCAHLSCRQQFISGWRPLPTDGRLPCRVWHARSMRDTGPSWETGRLQCGTLPSAAFSFCNIVPCFLLRTQATAGTQSGTTPLAVSAASCGRTLVIAWSTRLRPILTCGVTDMTVTAS